MTDDPKRKFRVVFNETRRFYCIQKKIFWRWYKTLDYKYRKLDDARFKLGTLRREYIKFKTKNKYTILDY